jgi:hypothetical protein
MGVQNNHFYGRVGAGGVNDSVINIDMRPNEQRNLADIAQEIFDLFNFFERTTITHSEAIEKVELAIKEQPSLNDAKLIEAAINDNPTLKQRLLAASSAASIETVKVLLPPLGVAIEAIKAYQNPSSK